MEGRQRYFYPYAGSGDSGRLRGEKGNMDLTLCYKVVMAAVTPPHSCCSAKRARVQCCRLGDPTTTEIRHWEPFTAGT